MVVIRKAEYVLKLESIGFDDGTNVVCERKVGTKDWLEIGGVEFIGVCVLKQNQETYKLFK